MEYYVYRHVRLDTQEPFYVGMAKKNPKKTFGHRTEYARAYANNKHRHTKQWHDIVSKTDYDVEILFETDDETCARQKEAEFILLYGRNRLGEGPLVNITEGGDNKEQIGLPGKPIVQMTAKGEYIKTWSSGIEIERSLGFLRTNIAKCCRKKALSAYGFTWKYLDNRQFDETYPCAGRRHNSNRCIGIEVYKNNVLIETLRTQNEASKKYNIDRSVLHGKIHSGKEVKGYLFKFRIHHAIPATKRLPACQ